MKTTTGVPGVSVFPLLAAWLGLLALTMLGLGLGHWSRGASWLAPAVAAVVWLKAWIVARHFIEAHLAHPFIAWVLRAFMAFVPAALLFTSWFGAHLARWTTL